MKITMGIVLLVALLATPGRLNASPLRAFTFSQPRATTCMDDDWAFATGNAFTSVRNAILNPANFGPAGIVPRSIEFVSDTLLTPAALIGVDIILLSVQADSLHATEKLTAQEFVRQGGGLFYFGNNAARNLAESFGGLPGGVNAPCGAVSAAIPPVTGPFGTASGCIAPNYHLSFASPGPGSVFLSDGAPVGVTYTLESGRAILLNDEEWICHTTVTPPCGVSGNNGTRFTLFMNALAWINPSESFEFDPGQVGVPETAPAVALIATPNPFADRTTIRVDGSGLVQVTIFDAAGRSVRRLSAGASAGHGDAVEWDGMDDSGRRLPSGIYLVRVESEGGGGDGDVRTVRVWLVR
ncbi:MAG: FlgD immunoglobulin-like domain containing protein [Candidatus Eisenbacteria bacterium]|nr:FlgD immunoglobulin-like domain containing protein [Candidatus Eisenbacteria bacterium]